MKTLSIDVAPMVCYSAKHEGIPIVCEQTGAITRTYLEMAGLLGLSQPLITRFMQGKCNHAKGYTFRFATKEEIESSGILES
jgi:hypothetical protein